MFICVMFMHVFQPDFTRCPQDERREWVMFHKRKWAIQAKQRADRRKRRRMDIGADSVGGGVIRSGPTSGLGAFIRHTARVMMDQPWQVVQVAQTGHPGMYKVKSSRVCQFLVLFQFLCARVILIKNTLYVLSVVAVTVVVSRSYDVCCQLWALIGSDLHAVKLSVPRIFYVNQKTPKENEGESK